LFGINIKLAVKVLFKGFLVLKCCFRLLGAKNPKKAFLGFLGLIPWGPTDMKRIYPQFKVPPVKG
jgi:hypothetical protein